jgi:uncharacterized protein (DUF58 family)
LLFVGAFVFQPLLFVAQSGLLVLAALLLADALLLYNPSIRIRCERPLPKLMSLGDVNQIRLRLYNDSPMPLWLSIVEELPDQFQARDFVIHEYLPRKDKKELQYSLRPLTRGVYRFHQTQLFLRSALGLIERRLSIEHSQQETAVYPSIIQMKKYELMALSRLATMSGIKKMRRVGHSYEFEQIRNYVKGDDYRSINWKATGRKNSLMVNQYEDERSQQIFAIIDKSRSMKLPFDGLTLMDYAINSALVITNIALHKYDKAGLLTFSDKIGATVKADNGGKHLQLILESLYRQDARDFEANYELLYTACRQFINRRSLLFLFTNFESHSALMRVLPLLRKINSLHLLVVIFFENPELVDYSRLPAQNTEDIYDRTIATQFAEEKQRIVQELRQYGIQAILTRPEELSINTVNKYLELKARGMI